MNQKYKRNTEILKCDQNHQINQKSQFELLGNDLDKPSPFYFQEFQQNVAEQQKNIFGFQNINWFDTIPTPKFDKIFKSYENNQSLNIQHEIIQVNEIKNNNISNNIQSEQSLITHNYQNFDSKQFNINQFEIGWPLGRGRYGKVYLAWYKKNNFIVALKVLNKHRLIQDQYIKQIRREMEIHSWMNHPNILKMYGYFWDDQNLYYILEYASEGELFDTMTKQPLWRFPEQTVSKIMKQCILATQYLHSWNIIHWDIKPENILLDDGEIKISDFGWSIFSPEPYRTTLCGTVEYLSPEMLNKFPYSKEIDIWCLGVLAYELSTGKSPFAGPDKDTIYNNIKNINAKYPNYITKANRGFIKRFLKINPKERITLDQALNEPFILQYNS